MSTASMPRDRVRDQAMEKAKALTRIRESHPMFLVPQYGLGREIQDLLREKLGIPPNAVSFSVHFKVDEVVMVECRYMPTEKQAAK